MVSEKGKTIVSSSNPMKINGQEIVVACESKNAEETASKEVTNEENAILEMKNGKIAMEEDMNEETASGEEESNEGSKMEDDKKNESIAKEENNEQNATAEEEEDEEAAAAEEEDDHQHEEIGEEKEENTVEQKEQKVGANSNDKVKRSRKRNRKKNMEEEEEEKGEENEENTNEQENDKVGANSVEKVKRPKKRTRRNKRTGKGSEMLATKKVEDKPGSLGNKKESERAEGMGMIFMCNSKTKKDCYRYNVLGLPASKREIVQKIYKGMRLFLYDFDLKLMYGIYKAAGPGGYNIEPEAFKSAFPSQVRFTVLEDCLPLAVEEFKTVIKENYHGKNKFDCQLNSTQVKDLCKLFSASSRGSKSKKLSRNGRAEPRIGRPESRIVKGEARTRIDRGRIRQQGRDKVRRSSALVADHRRHDARPTTYDMYRQRNRDEEMRSPLVGAHRHHERPIVYERELAPLHHLPPLPPPTAAAPLYSGPLPYAATPSYASYGRSLEIDSYGRDVIERRDPRLLNLDSRLDEIGSRDPYISYREVPSYRDTLYSSSSVSAQPEYYAPVEPRAEYRLAAPPPPEYRPPGAAALPDYDHLRPLYRY